MFDAMRVPTITQIARSATAMGTTIGTVDSSQASVIQQIIAALQVHGSKDDDELATLTGRSRQHINAAARRLKRQGILTRAIGPTGKLANTLVPGSDYGPLIRPPRPQPSDFITEDAVKQAVADHLEAAGYVVTVMWGRERGIDIEAVKPDDRIIIEAKGQAPAGAQQVNYFLNALGELVQRTSDEHARYALALPALRQYRNLAARLPQLARERLRLSIYFVDAKGSVEVV